MVTLKQIARLYLIVRVISMVTLKQIARLYLIVKSDKCG